MIFRYDAHNIRGYNYQYPQYPTTMVAYRRGFAFNFPLGNTSDGCCIHSNSDSFNIAHSIRILKAILK